MKLKAYLEKEKITGSDFAKKIGISQPALSNILNKKSHPRLETAYKIIKVTKGKVSLKDML